LTHDWVDGMAPYLRAYPYRLVRAQPGAFGVGLFSRTPLRTPAIVFPSERWPPVAHAVVGAGGAAVPLFIVHAPTPIRRGAAGRHRAFMASLGDLARAAGENALICGDLNATPWS